jgi:hypothetical protein
MTLNRCHGCARKFGLIVYHWLGYTFCSRKCKADYLAKRSQQSSACASGSRT